MLSAVGKSYSLKASSGKTGTAQSGIYNDGKEILRTWFAGYYPSKNPRYIIVIMNENGSSGTKDCVPVFKNIIRNISDR